MDYNWIDTKDFDNAEKYSENIERFKKFINKPKKINPIWEEIKDYIIKKNESLRLTYILYGFLQELYYGLGDRSYFNGESLRLFLIKIVNRSDLVEPSVDKIIEKIDEYINRERELEKDGYRVFCRGLRI